MKVRFLALAAAVAMPWLAASPAKAGAPDAALFVATFGEACIPERLSYPGALALAERLGWQRAVAGADAALDGFLDHAQSELEEAMEEDDIDFESEMAAFTRLVGGRPLHLVLTLMRSEIIDMTGCYLYDFAADALIDPAPVSALLGTEPAYATHGGDPDRAVDPALLVSTVWGPPPGLPRTFDTHLTYVPSDSPAVADVGFHGLVLTFSTSLPDEDAAR